MQVSANRGLFFTVISTLLILIGSYFAIQYAKGNYHFTESGFSETAGLLAVNSFPDGAKVYINGKLTTATDDTLYLNPNTYQVEIKKDGYSSWKKKLSIERNLVTQANARLFPSAPSLTPLTFIGVENLSPSPDGQKIVYFTASNSGKEKNGLWLMELAANPLSLQKGPKQISDNPVIFDLKKAEFIWSPDSDQLIVLTKNKKLLIDVNKNTKLNQLKSLNSKQFQTLLDSWENEMYLKEKQFLNKFPSKIIAIATQSAYNVYFSPDKKKLLYTASAAATIPQNLLPPLPAASTQRQERKLHPGSIYVYDREEDRNFKVGQEKANSHKLKKHLLTLQPDLKLGLLDAATTSAHLSLQASTAAETAKNWRVYHSPLYANTFQWYPDSNHLFFGENNTIKIEEYDGTNVQNLYAGPFMNQFIYPWPDGSRILIYTSFSPTTPLNLYAIELK